MAARLNKRHQDMVREKIRGSQLINVLTEHALGEKELAASQVTAGLGLLKKIIPDLKATEHTGKGGEELFPKALELTIVRPKKRSDPTET